MDVFFGRQSQARWLEHWEEICAKRVAHWAWLEGDERARLGEIIEFLVTRKTWEAANGFELTDEIVVTVAADAALLVLGLDVDYYRRVTAIVMHPGTVRIREARRGPGGVITDGEHLLLGQASPNQGPVVISWPSAKRGASHPEFGHNVVFHEFAHKLDMLTGVVDGVPAFGDPEERARWTRVIQRSFRRLRRSSGDPVLRSYGATGIGEFFAVATEAFFNRPLDLEEHHGELYDVLRSFYRQDTAARVRAATASADR